MAVAVTVGAALVLSLATLVLAASHNRPFDAVVRRPGREWWLREVGAISQMGARRL
jgi:hypothetical protein